MPSPQGSEGNGFLRGKTQEQVTPTDCEVYGSRACFNQTVTQSSGSIRAAAHWNGAGENWSAVTTMLA